jgi:integrase
MLDAAGPRCSPATLRLPPRPSPPEQGPPVSGGPTAGRRDHRRYAPPRRRRARRADARARSPVVAGRLRVGEALALSESDLDRSRGAVLVRHGKVGKRREVGMEPWGWEQLAPWLERRLERRSAPCSASSPARPSDDRGRAPLPSAPFGGWPPTPGFGAASPPHQLRHAHRRDGSRERAAQPH